MYKSFLIKYAEIGVKGKNRYIFEDRLCDQIRYALTRCEGEFEVTKTQGRIFIREKSSLLWIKYPPLQKQMAIILQVPI